MKKIDKLLEAANTTVQQSREIGGVVFVNDNNRDLSYRYTINNNWVEKVFTDRDDLYRSLDELLFSQAGSPTIIRDDIPYNPNLEPIPTQIKDDSTAIVEEKETNNTLDCLTTAEKGYLRRINSDVTKQLSEQPKTGGDVDIPTYDDPSKEDLFRYD